MLITIDDDFDLEKISNSGQAFRIRTYNDKTYRFLTNDHILYIRKKDSVNSNHFDISMYCLGAGDELVTAPGNEWDTVWVPYFDLARSYRDIRKMVPADDSFLNKSADYGAGLRILKQDSWEMLITFIISQRKNIPAIKESVEKICRAYGRHVTVPSGSSDTDFPAPATDEELFLFPSAPEMSDATLEELKKCSLGYRDTYILDAINRVNTGILDLSLLEGHDYDYIFNTLLEVRGVGAKVSNCICLFAYACLSAAPVDTWIAKVIDKYYNGTNPFPRYGEVSGIMQQYIFYYAQTHKDDF